MKEVNWTKWSSIAEIISSVAILITLIYLAVQTQQNTVAILSESRQNLFEGAQQEFPVWIQYPELTVFIIDNELEMTLEQKIQLDSLLLLSISRREFAWRQYEAGLLDEESWEAELEVLSLLVGTERLRDWWVKLGSTSFEQGFIDVINGIIENESYHPYWQRLKDW